MSTGYTWQIAQLQKAFPNGFTVTSSTNHSRLTSSGNVSLHTMGEAIDIVPKNGTTFDQLFKWIAQNYPNSAELFYTPEGAQQLKNGKPTDTRTFADKSVAADHYDHIHWGYTGPWTSSGTVAAGVTGTAPSGLTDVAHSFWNTVGPVLAKGSFAGVGLVMVVSGVKDFGRKVERR